MTIIPKVILSATQYMLRMKAALLVFLLQNIPFSLSRWPSEGYAEQRGKEEWKRQGKRRRGRKGRESSLTEKRRGRSLYLFLSLCSSISVNQKEYQSLLLTVDGSPDSFEFTNCCQWRARKRERRVERRVLFFLFFSPVSESGFVEKLRPLEAVCCLWRRSLTDILFFSIIARIFDEESERKIISFQFTSWSINGHEFVCDELLSCFLWICFWRSWSEAPSKWRIFSGKLHSVLLWITSDNC